MSCSAKIRLCFVCIVMAACCLRTAAQSCGGQWLHGDGILGTDNEVNAAILWDPDGTGPAPAQLVVGGRFSIAGDTFAANIAAWNPQTRKWSALGSGIAGTSSAAVNALAVLPNGELLAVGKFAIAGGLPAKCMARWDGTNWNAVGGGVGGVTNPAIYAVAVLQNGNIVVGGSFLTAGSINATCIAQWDGANWSAFGTGMSGGAPSEVYSLAQMPGGDIVAGGRFKSAGGVSANNIARWNGNSWLPLGGGFTGFNPYPYVLRVLKSGNLLAGGAFSIADGVNTGFLASWDGSAWTRVGTPVSDDGNSSPYVNDVMELQDGKLVAAGAFIWRGDSKQCSRIAQWDGSTWIPMSTGIESPVFGPSSPRVNAIAALPNGDLVAAGIFNSAGTLTTSNLATWNGIGWKPFGEGPSDDVRSLAISQSGRILASGEFNTAAGVKVDHSAIWNGCEWSPIGSGWQDTIYGRYATSAVWSSTDRPIVAGFQVSPSLTSSIGHFVGEWQGDQWLRMGAALDGVSELLALPSGEIIAGGSFKPVNGVGPYSLALWDGSNWAQYATGLAGSSVYAMRPLASGGIVVGGKFFLGPNIVKWNGSKWSLLGTGTSDSVYAVCELPNGHIAAGGNFAKAGGTTVNQVALWDGVAWHALAGGVNGTVWSLAARPNGDLIVGGGFSSAGGVSANCIARWDGSKWSSLGQGLNGIVYDIKTLPNGDLIVGGGFTTAGGEVSAFTARWTENNIPWVANQPDSVTAERHSVATLSAAPANGYRDVHYQWYLNHTPIVDGPSGASAGGGVVGGSSGRLESPTRASSASLRIVGAQPSDSGLYSIVFDTPCGQVSSQSASVAIRGCPADLNGDDVIESDDFQIFSARYDLALCSDAGMDVQCAADFNGDGFVDDADFVLFIVAYNLMLCG